jgi:hypothetical protein
MSKQVRVGDDIDVRGLISTLRKTDPAGIKRLEHQGGRLGGVAMANDKKRQDPNQCARLKNALKLVSG